MRIKVDEFVVTLTEPELWNITFSLRDSLLELVDHCNQHEKWDTLKQNDRGRLDMFESFCTRLDRVDVFNDFIRQADEVFDNEDMD